MSTATVIPIRREFQVHRFDPIKHGVLSRHVALPWEDRDEFEEILRGLLVEHAPQGPTAYHLVEDLAGVIWRKRRLLQAEGAAIREKFHRVTRGIDSQKAGRYALAHKDENLSSGIVDIVADRLPTPEKTAADLKMVDRALALLNDNRRDAYRKALQCLDEATLQAWEDEAIDESDPYAEGYERDAGGLGEFLTCTRDRLDGISRDKENAPLVADQIRGMAIDIRDLDRIARIEAHLDRKLAALLGLLDKRKKA